MPKGKKSKSLAELMDEATVLLDINGTSRHLGTDVKYNENNIGVGLTAELDNKLLTAGNYRNSFGKPSYYAGAGITKKFGNSIYAKLGLLGGAVSGYEKKLTPMVLPMASIGSKNLWELRMMYAPEYEKSPATLMMNLGIPIK